MKPGRNGQPGYYPGFSTLGQQAHWDEATRKTVLERVSRSRELRFFPVRTVIASTASIVVSAFRPARWVRRPAR